MEGRYRFTLAHEGGGHWRLHRHLFAKDPAQASLFGGPAAPSVVCRSSQAKERVEWQADFYASCLLMPRKLVFAAWDEMFPDRKQRVLQPRTPIDHPFVEIARFECSIRGSDSTRPTIRRWTASRGPSPKSSSSRRSPCASGSKSSGCFTARCRFSGFCPMAREPFFEENVKC